jgi:hypothetical protein
VRSEGGKSDGYVKWVGRREGGKEGRWEGGKEGRKEGRKKERMNGRARVRGWRRASQRVRSLGQSINIRQYLEIGPSALWSGA